MGGALVLVTFLVLWFTAPEWKPLLRPGGGSSGPVQYVLVNTTVWKFSGPTCWQNQVGAGGTIRVGTGFSASLLLPYPLGNSSPACEVSAITVLPANFTLVSTNAPLTVTAGQTDRLYANVTVPEDPYTGALTVQVQVVQP